MSVHKLNVKNVLSRIRQVFPNVPESYLISLINDALVEIGVYSTKQIQAKMSTVADQMWYKIGDDAEDSSGNKLEANKVFRVVDRNILLMDADSNESALTTPDSK